MTVCTCTNGLSIPPDSTGNCPKPLPTETSDQIFIWHYYYASDNNNDTNVYDVSQSLNVSRPLVDLHRDALFSLKTQDSLYGMPNQLGPFVMEDRTLGACTYTGLAAGKGSVACANGSTIKCYNLVAGDPAQPARRSFLVEAGRLLIVCSNSI